MFLFGFPFSASACQALEEQLASLQPLVCVGQGNHRVVSRVLINDARALVFRFCRATGPTIIVGLCVGLSSSFPTRVRPDISPVAATTSRVTTLVRLAIFVTLARSPGSCAFLATSC